MCCGYMVSVPSDAPRVGESLAWDVWIFFGNFRKLTVSWYAPRAGESLAWDIWILNNFQEFWVFWNFVNFLRCYRKVRKLNPRALFCYLNVSESLVQVCPLRCLESTSVRVFSATFVGRYGSCYISLIATFLVACTRLFTLFRPLVGPSVGPSVRRCWPGARDLWRLALFYILYCDAEIFVSSLRAEVRMQKVQWAWSFSYIYFSQVDGLVTAMAVSPPSPPFFSWPVLALYN